MSTTKDLRAEHARENKAELLGRLDDTRQMILLGEYDRAARRLIEHGLELRYAGKCPLRLQELDGEIEGVLGDFLPSQSRVSGVPF